jgi:hypothetical protein
MGGSLSLRPAWSIERIPGQPGLCRQALSQKKKKKKKKSTNQTKQTINPEDKTCGSDHKLGQSLSRKFIMFSGIKNIIWWLNELMWVISFFFFVF